MSTSASSGVTNPTTPAPRRIRCDTASGYVAANSAPIAPPSEDPYNAARAEPATAITARTSSIRSSIVGTPTTRSDMPVPRLSSRIRRENDARRRRYAAIAGSSQCVSRCPIAEGTKTKSCGPSPTT